MRGQGYRRMIAAALFAVAAGVLALYAQPMKLRAEARSELSHAEHSLVVRLNITL